MYNVDLHCEVESKSPLPCGGDLGVGINMQGSVKSMFGFVDLSTHPLAPSAREGEQENFPHAMDGERESGNSTMEREQENCLHARERKKKIAHKFQEKTTPKRSV